MQRYDIFIIQHTLSYICYIISKDCFLFCEQLYYGLFYARATVIFSYAMNFATVCLGIVITFADSVLETYSRAARFLIRYEGRYAEAPEDSMAAYCNIPLTIFEITHSEEALELR